MRCAAALSHQLVDAFRQRPDRLTATTAAGCAIVAWLVVPGQMLVCAFAAFAGVLIVRMLLARRAERA